MNVRQHLHLFMVILCLFAFALAGAADVGPTYAIRKAKIVPVAGPVIEKGSLIIETKTNIKKVYIDGKECDLSNKYTELLEKFKKRG